MLTNREIAHFADQLPAGVKVVDMRGYDRDNIWEFVVKFYPNYYKCDEIAYNDDLSKIVNGEYLEEGSGALDLYNNLKEKWDTKGQTDEDYVHEMVLKETGILLKESNAYIYEKAIEGFLEFMRGGNQ